MKTIKIKTRNNYPTALRRFREENDISRHELANMLDVKYSSLGHWLAGRYMPTGENQKKIKQLFKAYNFKMRQYDTNKEHTKVKQNEIISNPRQQVMTVLSDNMTSLELVKQINHFRSLIGKPDLRHKDLLNIIRDEFEEEISQRKISPSDYRSSRGKVYPMFNLTISQAKQVLVRESKQVRRAVIKYLESLEQQLQQRSEPQIQPQTLEITNKAIIKHLINLDDTERKEVVNYIQNLDKIIGA